MNLVLRLLLLILRKLWGRRTPDPLYSAEVTFWCLPHDCDFHMHMTNSRFSSFCDLARISAMFDYGVMGKLMKNGYAPIVTAQNIMHFREISMLRKFSITSRIIGWTDRFWYYQHDFYQGGVLRATVYAKGFFVCRKKVLPFQDIVGLTGKSVSSPQLAAIVQSWSDGTDTLFAKAKESR